MAETIQHVIAQNAGGTSPSRPAENAEAPSTGKSKKIFMILAAILFQLVGAYFLIGFLFRHGNSDPQASGKVSQQNQSAVYERGGGDPNFDHVYVVKDLVVNPAGTNGLRFLLATIGLEVTSEETVKELEKRDIEIHDSIIDILTSKTLPELDDTGLRDSLKSQIKLAINRDLTTGKVLNVYFSKFIIQ